MIKPLPSAIAFNCWPIRLVSVFVVVVVRKILYVGLIKITTPKNEINNLLAILRARNCTIISARKASVEPRATQVIIRSADVFAVCGNGE